MARPRFQVVSVTDRAAERVREILANADSPAEGIRIGVKKGGCAGMEYTVDLVTRSPSRRTMWWMSAAPRFS